MESANSRGCGSGILSVVLTAMVCLHPASADEVLGRYSVLRETPTQFSDPLAVAVNQRFGPEVASVEDAVRALLVGTGVSLSSAESGPAARAAALARVLPAEQRAIETTTLREALQRVIGVGFTLVEDSAHHLVSFEPCDAGGEAAR